MCSSEVGGASERRSSSAHHHCTLCIIGGIPPTQRTPPLMRSPKSSRKWAVHWEIYWLNHPHWKWQWQGHYLIAQRTYEYETMHPAQLRHRNLQFKHNLTNPLIIYESTQHAIVTDPIRWFLLKLLHIREVDSTFYLKWCSLCLHSREDQSNNSAHSHSSIRFVFYKLQFD